ncbi:hypothetical protein C6V83_10995 [Gordonia iterans]|uniref:AAA+ ATPase domain-containing protein n=1 Tax=Gordonia iterans TaxID=1004901 RepID=A0A2S0KGC0_9ACTN|nr:hypothetical protein C6V83_10995 [Gordonia iterans]
MKMSTTSSWSARAIGFGMTRPSTSDARTSVKNTLVGMRRRIDRVVDEPEAHSREEYEQLPDAEREMYDARRVRWFGSGFTLSNEATTSLLRSVRAYLAMRDLEAIGSQGVCVLTGPANVGKSTSLLQLAKEAEARAYRRYSAFREDGHVPVALIEMAPGATPKGVATSLLDFFAVPYRQRDSHQVLVRQASEVIAQRRTSLLIVDEFHAVQLDGRRGDDAINTVKAIINNTGVVTVLAGIDLDVHLGSRAAEQLMARGETHRHSPFDYASEGSRRSWARLVKAFATQMSLVDGPPDLSEYADGLHAITGGRIGALRRVLGFAMLTMLEEKESTKSQEELTDRHLGIAANSTAQRQPAACKKKPA